jgi:hypothetical protein
MEKVRGYAPPVCMLLMLGRPGDNQWAPEGWADYRGMGLGPEHADELVRLARDVGTYRNGDEASCWGPVHAWRALGQLQIAAGAEAILAVLRKVAGSDDWETTTEEVPHVLGAIGGPAIKPAADLLVNVREHVWARSSACDGLATIGRMHPELRDGCLAPLVTQLKIAEYNQPEVNTGVLSALMTLGAVEAAPWIERAYGVAQIEEDMVGSLEEVLQEINMTPEERALRLAKMAAAMDDQELARAGNGDAQESRELDPLKVD